MLKRQGQVEEEEGQGHNDDLPYFPSTRLNYEPQMNGSRVNTAESTITHVSNDTLQVVVTTIGELY